MYMYWFVLSITLPICYFHYYSEVSNEELRKENQKLNIQLRLAEETKKNILEISVQNCKYDFFIVLFAIYALLT